MKWDKSKLLIYQVLPRLYGNTKGANIRGGSIADNGCGKLSDFTPERLHRLHDLGFTHIWYTGVLEHATTTHYPGIIPDHPDIVKGAAGSPYAIKDYFDIDPDLAEVPEHRRREFDELIELSHFADLDVIIDFVPNHLAREYHSDNLPPFEEDFGYRDDTGQAFARDNNFYYLPGQMLVIGSDYGPEPSAYSEHPALVTGNDVFHTHPTKDDWYDTVKLNYGFDPTDRSEHFGHPIQDTWKKMFGILYYWAASGIDGFRCDMAEMVPVPFWQWCIAKLREYFPDILFIGEIYQPHRYQEYLDAGFDYLYDKVGLYDTLIGTLRGERPAADITRIWQQQEDFSGHMLHFMENHDEQRLASDFILGKGADAIPAVAVSSLIDSGPMMIYFGQMLGERGMDEEGFSGINGRTSIYDYWSMDTMSALHSGHLTTDQRTLRERYRRLLHLAARPVFCEGQFFDLMYAVGNQLDNTKQFAFLRYTPGTLALVVVNFADHDISLSLTLPKHAFETLHCPEGLPSVKLNPVTGDVGVDRPDSVHPLDIHVAAHDYTALLYSPLGKRVQ